MFMPKIDPRVDAYMAALPDFARPIMEHLRALVHQACPDVEETWKWSFPNFKYHGAMLCHMAAFKKHCAFGFWKAAIMQDPSGVLSTTERSGMGHLGKIERLEDLPSDKVLLALIKAAAKLNDDNIKVARAPKPTAAEKSALEIPQILTEALAQNTEAAAHFERFSYSHKKEYVQWINEAKTDVTRAKRAAQTVAWLAEGKSRNWKYEKC